VLYSFYFLVVTVFFLYQLFPSETVKRYVEGLGSRLDPALKTTVEQVRPAFPAHILLSDIRVRYNRRLLFKAGKATVAPRFFSFLWGKRGYTLRSRVYGGTVNARLETVSDLMAGQLEVSALDLASIPVLKRFENIEPAGRLDCRLDFIPENGLFTAGGGFHIKDFKVNLESMIPGMAVLSFSGIDGKIRFRGNKLTVTDGKARGRQADAGIHGTLTIEKPFIESALDLSLSVRPHADLITALRRNPALQWLSAGMTGKTGLPLRIGGTIEDPQISVK
jgi:type II secretion system protein N